MPCACYDLPRAIQSRSSLIGLHLVLAAITSARTTSRCEIPGYQQFAASGAATRTPAGQVARKVGWLLKARGPLRATLLGGRWIVRRGGRPAHYDIQNG